MYSPRSYISDTVLYADGGVTKIAASAGLAEDRLLEIVRGAGAEPPEAIAIARAVRVPVSFLFVAPAKRPAWIPYAITGGVMLGLFFIGLAAIGVFVLVHGPIRPPGAPETAILHHQVTSTTTAKGGPVIPKQ